MASPADSSGLNTPLLRLTWTAPTLLPALRLSVAMSAAETVLSAVTMMRSDAASAYQAMPSTPDCATAVLTAESRPAPKCSEDAAPAGRAYTATDARPTVTARSRAVREIRPRTEARSMLTGSSRGVNGTSRAVPIGLPAGTDANLE